MKPDKQSSEPDDPLNIARCLERVSRQDVQSEETSPVVDDIPADFELARQGLDLIRRALQADQWRVPTVSTIAETSTGFVQTADTDRLLMPDAATKNGPPRSKPVTTSPTNTPTDSIPIPRQIGRFQIVRELGRGGFGMVLLGNDPELDRKVAIKVPRLEMLIDADARERFYREACLVSTLAHPAIVPVFEYSSGPGIPFIAFAWCRGPTLADWFKQHSDNLTPVLAAKIVSHLAGAVEYAHQRDVVHRDLKPGNVLLDLDATDGEPVFDAEQFVASLQITDFGLARPLQLDRERLTRAGAMVGTPSYMAPELFSGVGDSGASADVYALGAILYELLTGQPPLNRETDLATMRAVESEPPVPPSKINKDISRDLEAVALKCLEKSPGDRYRSAHELQQDLDRFLSGLPVSACRITRMEQAIRWCRRNPLLAGLSATTAAAVLIAAIASWAGWYSTRQSLLREQSARVEADQAYRDAKSAIDQYFLTVSQNQLLTAPGLKSLRQELLQNAIAYYSGFIEKHQDDEHLARDLLKAFVHRATIDDELGNYPEAREGFETALQMLGELRQSSETELELQQQHGMILRKLARLDRQAGDKDAALAKIEQAIVLHQELLNVNFECAVNHFELGMLLNNRANIEFQSGNPSAALDLHQESEVHFLAAATLEPDNPRSRHQLTTARGAQAAIRLNTGDSQAGEQLLSEVVQSLRQLVDDHPDQLGFQMDLGKALANFGLAQSNLGRYDEVLTSYQEATQVFDRLATIHPQVVMYQALRASTRRSSAHVLNNMDRLPESAELADEAINILQEVLSRSPGNAGIEQELVLTRVLLGRVWRARGDSEKARQYLTSAIESLEAEFGQNPGNLYAGQNLAGACQQLALATEDPEDARRQLDRAEEIVATLLEKWPGNSELVDIQGVIETTRRQFGDQDQ